MGNTYGSRDLSEGFQDFLFGVAKLVLGLGALATLSSVGLLVYTCFHVAGDPSVAKAAMGNIDIFQRVLVAGTVGVAVGAGYMFWGEDLAAGILILLSAALYFSPMYLPGLLGGNAPTEAVGACLAALQMGGTILGILSIGTLGVELGIKIRDRITVGVKADQLKYGKGIKEEKDRQNVFMGNCWQLPYCRKFVRERCPIFHAKRTCWRERTGCMCEEEVIRNAMDNKPIPKDALLAAKMIPRNHRLTEQQKVERCKNCVIYNEHQRHKYKLVMPTTVVLFFATCGGLYGVLLGMVRGAIEKMNDVLRSATANGVKGLEPPPIFVEIMLFVFMFVALTYVLKLVEYTIFTLKK